MSNDYGQTNSSAEDRVQAEELWRKLQDFYKLHFFDVNFFRKDMDHIHYAASIVLQIIVDSCTIVDDSHNYNHATQSIAPAKIVEHVDPVHVRIVDFPELVPVVNGQILIKPTNKICCVSEHAAHCVLRLYWDALADQSYQRGSLPLYSYNTYAPRGPLTIFFILVARIGFVFALVCDITCDY